MSSAAEGRGPALPPQLDHLELVVRRLLHEYERWRRQAVAAQERARELEATIQRVAGGGGDPVELADRIRELEAENRALRVRLEEAMERVRGMLRRLEFLEEDR